MPGQIVASVIILTLAFSVGAGLPSGTGAHQPDRAAGQDHPQAGATSSKHKYTQSSGWISCGAIPYRGWEGRRNQEGSVLKCSDGAKVYDVEDSYTSARAAEAEHIARLEEKGPKRKPWRIARTESLGDATIIEFAEPVSVLAKENASNNWAIMWRRDKSLFLIYGPDREHVIDYYQTRYVGGVMK